jgi:arginine deiminase
MLREHHLDISSEFGRLRSVIVHTPGRELEMITPRNYGLMLFDDILYLDAAREDHRQLIRVLQHAGVTILEVKQLLESALSSVETETCRDFVHQICQSEGYDAKQEEQLLSYAPEGLADALIAGEPKEESLSRFMRTDLYAFPPIPNLMFVRDCAAIVNNGLVLGRMAHSVRSRETLLFDFIFRHHPYFKGQDFSHPWYWLQNFEQDTHHRPLTNSPGYQHVFLEGTNFRLKSSKGTLSVGKQETDSISNDNDIMLTIDDVRLKAGDNFVLEGGNIFVLSEDTLLIGCGTRASVYAVDTLAHEMLGKRSRIRNIIVTIFADDKDNHLDTFFAVMDKDEYLIHPLYMQMASAQITVHKMWLDKSQIRVREYSTLEKALKSIDGFAPQLVPNMSGFDSSPHTMPDIEKRIQLDREWSNQALNLLPLAPGVVVVSERNQHTLAQLTQRGYRIITADEFLDKSEAEIEAEIFDDKAQAHAITVNLAELSRAHGGPRSLVLPLVRELVPREYTGRNRHLQEASDSFKGGKFPALNPDTSQHIQTLSVNSEIGQLTHVILHRPGPEIERMSPSNHDRLLFDDILDINKAQQEHQEFEDLLKALGINVLMVEDLLYEALKNKMSDADKRASVIEDVCELEKLNAEENVGNWLPSYRKILKKNLEALADGAAIEEFARTLIKGVCAEPENFAKYLNDEDPFLLTPIPNLLFMRDPAAVVGDRWIVSYMMKPTRRLEGLLLHFIGEFLAAKIGIKVGWDAFALVDEDRPQHQTLEGGDVLVIHDKILAIGCSERTSREMMELVGNIFLDKDFSSIEEVFVVLMPQQRSSMHLDTIFTMISETECLVYPPMILPEGTEQVKVIKMTKTDSGAIVLHSVDSLVIGLEKSLRKHTGNENLVLNAIKVGGDNLIYQDREQWCDGANMLALAPGVVVGYERNSRSFLQLETLGYTVCKAHNVIANLDLAERIRNAMCNTGTDSREKFAIHISDKELSRARGGPRCMSMPIHREKVNWDSV